MEDTTENTTLEDQEMHHHHEEGRNTDEFLPTDHPPDEGITQEQTATEQSPLSQLNTHCLTETYNSFTNSQSTEIRNHQSQILTNHNSLSNLFLTQSCLPQTNHNSLSYIKPDYLSFPLYQWIYNRSKIPNLFF